MANKFKGEVQVVVDGVTYTLRMDMNAMCAFEELTGKKAIPTLEAMEVEGGMGSVSDMRAFMWAMLQEDHPEVTLKDAGRIMSENVDALGEAIAAAAPEAEPTDAAGKKPVGNSKARPKKAR